MRTITFTNTQFRSFVFPMVGKASSANDEELGTSLSLLRTLKDPALTQIVPYNEEQEKAIAEGHAVMPEYRLLESTATFEFEEAEWSLLKKRLAAAKRTMPALAWEAYETVVRLVEEAPEQKRPQVQERS